MTKEDLCKRMEDIIKQTKDEAKRNGNGTLKPIDMRWYLIGKIDKISDRVDKIYEKLDSKVNNKTFYSVIGIITVVLIAIFNVMANGG